MKTALMRNLLILLIFCLFLSCDKKNTKNNQLRLCYSMDVATLDPRKTGDVVSSSMSFLLFSGLTEVQSDGSIALALAKSYDLSEDKKAYTFYLGDHKWSDGSSITAYDFEKSWKKTISPAFPSLCPQLFYCIKNAELAANGKVNVEEVKIKAIDDKTLRIDLEYPTPYFLSLVSFCVFSPVPSHIEKVDDSGKALVCSGPYTLKKRVHNHEFLLEKNPLFWNAKKTNFLTIHISVVNDDNTALQLYEQGDLDWIGAPLCQIPPESLSFFEKQNELQITPIGGTVFCAFNTDTFPFNNYNIRKAFSLAMNRASIIKHMTQQKEKVATRLFPPVIMNEVNKDLLFDNNTDLAKKYLAKGLEELKIKKEDLSVTFSFSSNFLHKKIAQALQENWLNAFGINVQLQQHEKKYFLANLHRHQFKIAIGGLILQYNDPMNILERFKYKSQPKNYPAWEDQTYIDLLDEAQSQSDPVKRSLLLEKAESYICEKLPITPLYHMNYVQLQKPYVKNIFIGPIGDIHFHYGYFNYKEKS